MAERYGVATVSAPPAKITVLLLGNHSSGKSSFINWYTQEHIQRVSVAMETMNFTLVTSGARRETLTAAAALEFWPRAERALRVTTIGQESSKTAHSSSGGSVKYLAGVPDYLQAEVSVSSEKQFPLVDFIDTPGLVDGMLTYPYPVEDILVKLADMSDLIFMFFGTGEQNREQSYSSTCVYRGFTRTKDKPRYPGYLLTLGLLLFQIQWAKLAVSGAW